MHATSWQKLAESKSAEVTALEAELKLLQVEKLERDSGRHTVAHADNVLSAPISKQLRIVELLIMKERWAIRTKLSSCT